MRRAVTRPHFIQLISLTKRREINKRPVAISTRHLPANNAADSFFSDLPSKTPVSLSQIVANMLAASLLASAYILPALAAVVPASSSGSSGGYGGEYRHKEGQTNIYVSSCRLKEPILRMYLH